MESAHLSARERAQPAFRDVQQAHTRSARRQHLLEANGRRRLVAAREQTHFAQVSRGHNTRFGVLHAQLLFAECLKGRCARRRQP